MSILKLGIRNWYWLSSIPAIWVFIELESETSSNTVWYWAVLGLLPHPFSQFGPHPLGIHLHSPPPLHPSSPSCCLASPIFLVSLARRHGPAPPRLPAEHPPSEFHDGHPVLVLLSLDGAVEPRTPPLFPCHPPSPSIDGAVELRRRNPVAGELGWGLGWLRCVIREVMRWWTTAIWDWLGPARRIWPASNSFHHGQCSAAAFSSPIADRGAAALLSMAAALLDPTSVTAPRNKGGCGMEWR
jgi:hypothetical protein